MMLITLVIGASTANECSLAPDGRRWLMDITFEEPERNTHIIRTHCGEWVEARGKSTFTAV